MIDGVHVRLMVTRGVKSTPYQDPRVTVGPGDGRDHRRAQGGDARRPSSDGITLFTTHVRRAYPDTLDPKLNSHSKLNDITACIQAYTAGADEALMLDPHGFVATCNSTHFFVVKGTPDEPEVWTSDGRFCLGGITRGNVLAMCRDGGITARETTFSLTDVYSAAGGVRDRDVRGRRTGADRRRPHHRHRRARPGRRAAAADVRRPGRRRRRGTVGAVSRDDPGRDVERAAQHLDRDDALLGEPRRTPSSSTSRSTPPTSPAPASTTPAATTVHRLPADRPRPRRSRRCTRPLPDGVDACTTPST